MKIKLSKYNSKRSANTNIRLNVDMSRNGQLLPLGKMAMMINEEEIYQQERANCNKIRLITTINPICSNVLYNKLTEVVYNEGSIDDCYLLNMACSEPFKQEGNNLMYKNKINTVVDAIRDTQLTRFDEYTYHCGLDIFNNHILRSQTFKTVCLPKNSTETNEFNTIMDMMRTSEGNNVRGYKNNEHTMSKGEANMDLHLYTSDDILSFNESINENLVEENGWVGFNNASTMKVYSGLTISDFSPYKNEVDIFNISKVINNKSACDFICLAPEKDLFSFTPKYNKFQHRLEKNWNYQLTYPSSSTTKVSFIREETNSLKIVYYNDQYKHSNGTNCLKIYSISKHGLNVDDRVNIYNGNTIAIRNSRVIFIENEHTFLCELGSQTLSRYMIDLNSEVWKEFESTQLVRGSALPFAEEYNLIKNVTENFLNAVIQDGYENAGSIIKIPYIENELMIYCNKVNWDLYINDATDAHDTITVQGVSPIDGVTTGGQYNQGENSITFALQVDSEQEVIVETTPSGSSKSARVKIIIPKAPTRDKIAKKFYVQPTGIVNMDEEALDVSYKQVINGEEVEYYVRIFSVLPNWKEAKEKPTEYNIYKDGSTLISDNQIEFNNNIGTVGFAKNIYGDDISQIVFTDDINIEGLKDNLGRPLSEIYLTILKNNKGYKEWYDENNWGKSNGTYTGKLNETIAPEIEFSHVFGKLNCGLNLSPNAIILDETEKRGHITAMNNVYEGEEGAEGFTPYMSLKGLPKLGDSTTDEIDPNNDKHFYGDLCCLSRIVYAEKTIDDIMFRFNTAQRELGTHPKNDGFCSGITYDEITRDDYDAETTYNYVTTWTFPLDFHQSGEDANATKESIPTDWWNYYPCARPEGYCYKAHYKIPIKTYSQELESQYPKTSYIKNLKIESITSDNSTIYGILSTKKENYFELNDSFVFYDDITDSSYLGFITEIQSRFQFKFKLAWDKNRNFTDEVKLNQVRLLRKDETIPSYALLTQDGTCRYVWRWLLQNGEDKYRNTEVYPFTNGAFYVNQQINFYLKRQDPLSYMAEYSTFEFNDGVFNIESNKITTKNDDSYKSEKEILC